MAALRVPAEEQKDLAAAVGSLEKGIVEKK
jgi:hypothetical protein